MTIYNMFLDQNRFREVDEILAKNDLTSEDEDVLMEFVVKAAEEDPNNADINERLERIRIFTDSTRESLSKVKVEGKSAVHVDPSLLDDQGKVTFVHQKLSTEKLLSPEYERQIDTLRVRFYANHKRHKEVSWWSEVEEALRADPEVIASLIKLEETGGEPDVIFETKDGKFVFGDWSPETPSGRTDVVYDRQGDAWRKQYRKDLPDSMVRGIATEMIKDWKGARLMPLHIYEYMQDTLDEKHKLDQKTTSLLATSRSLREQARINYGNHEYCGRDHNPFNGRGERDQDYGGIPHEKQGFRCIVVVKKVDKAKK